MTDKEQEEHVDVCLECLRSHDLHIGNMISYSKSIYRRENPDNLIVFNANLFSEKANMKFWWGDLDIAKSGEVIQKAADLMEDTWYVLTEHGYTYKEGVTALEMVKERSVWSSKREGP